MRRPHKFLCVFLTWALIVVVVLVTISKWNCESKALQNRVEITLRPPSLKTTPTPMQRPNSLQKTQHNNTRTNESSSSGYMVALRYYEQQTQGLRNILRLQCFANSYGMKVLEPFIQGSKFASHIPEIVKGETFMRFRDLFDIGSWNQQAASDFGYPGLASWSDFLRDAPKQVIIFSIKYRKPRQMTRGFNYMTGCSTHSFEYMIATVEALSVYGFRLVRRACANFEGYRAAITVEQFMQLALGAYSPNEVTIVMNDFRGFFGIYRLPVLSNCGIIHHYLNISVTQSQQILEDTKKYHTRYLEDRPYVAIMARIERVVLHLNHDPASCFKSVIKTLEAIQSKHNYFVNRFLAMDVGKFGSDSAKNLQPTGEALFNMLYGHNWSIEEWEKTFERSVFANNSAYIANLQRTIASQAECLIMVGGGSFQKLAKHDYDLKNPDLHSKCVYEICVNDIVRMS